MLTLEKLAKISGSELLGDPNCQIAKVASIQQAEEGDISFVRDAKYQKHLDATKASAVILPEPMSEGFSGNRLINADPYLAYAKVLMALHPTSKPETEIHLSAIVDPSCDISGDVFIGANVVIGQRCKIASGCIIEASTVIDDDCHIGCDTRLKSNVTLNSHTQIGDRCLIHSGAVLGADGFGFAPQKNGKWYKIQQIGNVILGNNVEVGANTCIDRAAMGSTLIGDGVILDNLIQVGHNVKIGDNTAIAAHTAIAGSTTIGKNCRIAGAVAIVGHIEIVDDVMVTGTSFVNHSIHKAGVYSSGLTIDDNRSWRRNVARFKKLDRLYRKILKLEKRK